MPGEWYVEEQGDRRWWMPILVASVALAVLAALGSAVWLLARPEPGRAPQVPPSVPSDTGGPTTPVRVSMPDLVGLPRSAAEAELDRTGLGYRSELRWSDRPAGTVVGTEPGAGERVLVGTDVTLVVSEGGRATRSPGMLPTAPAPPSAGTGTPSAGSSAPRTGTGTPSAGSSAPRTGTGTPSSGTRG